MPISPNWAMGKRGFAPIWAMGLFGASICSAEPGSPHPCPSIAPLQINPLIAHSQCCLKRCWANLAYSAISKLPRGLRNKISAFLATVASVRTMDRISESTEKGLRFWGSRSEVSKIILNRVLCLILIASKLSQVAKDMGC